MSWHCVTSRDNVDDPLAGCGVRLQVMVGLGDLGDGKATSDNRCKVPEVDQAHELVQASFRRKSHHRAHSGLARKCRSGDEAWTIRHGCRDAPAVTHNASQLFEIVAANNV